MTMIKVTTTTMTTRVRTTTMTIIVTTIITTTTETLAELDSKMQYFAAMHNCSRLFLKSQNIEIFQK